MFIVPCPSCGRCGCECGRLPYTVTATFSDLAQRNRTAECELSLSSCFGSGATAVVMQPGGCTNTPTCSCDGSDAGPITEVLLTNGGSCYATFGREEPTVLAFASVGTGAELEVTLTEGTDDCGLPAWSVSSVSVIEPGSGYVLGLITLTVVAPGIESQEGFAEITALTPQEPTGFVLSSQSQVGSGAVFVVTVTQSGSSPDRWAISAVAVTSGGSGYIDGNFLVVDAVHPLIEEVAAVLLLRTVREPPELDAFPFSGGSGAAFLISVIQSGSSPDIFSADTITVTSPGSGYVNGDTFQIFPTSGVTDSPGFATATVDGGGGLLALTVTDGGEFYIDTGVVESVEVQSGGAYYNGDGIDEVTVTFPGEYYLPNRDLPALSAVVTIFDGTCFRSGSAAEITATVDDDVDSDTFGQVISLNIVNGGSGYLSWTYLPGCLDRLNGESLVLRASDPHKLITLEVQSCYGSGACLEVETFLPPCEYDGAPTELPGVILTSGGEGYAKLGRVEPTLSLAAENGVGATLTPTLDKKADDCGLDYWYIDTVATKGGTGYLASNIVKVSVTKGIEEEPAALTLTASEGVPTGVTIERAGKYYLESNEIAAYTPSIKVAVVQLPPSIGKNAAVSVTVNTDPLAGDFGKITGVSLTNKGSDYLLLGGPKYCEYEGPCKTTLSFSGSTVIGLLAGTFNKSDPQPDCDDISSETTIQRGLTAGTVNVEAGGLWSLCAEQDCGECPDECPEEVTVTVSVCGETITLTMPIPGSASFQSVLPGENEGFILIDADNGCDTTGCGWAVTVNMCSQCADEPPRNGGEVHRGCVAEDAEGCPVLGAVTMVCLNELLDPPLECFATVTVSIG